MIERVGASHQQGLERLLAEHGIEAAVIHDDGDLELTGEESPKVVLVDASTLTGADVRHFAERCRQAKLIALAPESRLAEIGVSSGISDFVLLPLRPAELVARAKWAIRRTLPQEDPDVMRVGELVIKPTRYEVSLGERRIDLRFKEYELLRLMASHPGRVFTREALLNEVWGYHYFGGTRTVDVHIRRLRSKIEDSDHAFIETVWQVGYRLKDPSSGT